jgi:hypothetical protein
MIQENSINPLCAEFLELKYAEFLELKCNSLEERVSFFEEQLTESRNKETEFMQALEPVSYTHLTLPTSP